MNQTPRKNLNKKDLQDTRPIAYRNTLDLVSAFVIHTTEFLNKFASTCEEKLNKVESNIKQMEITLNLLEAKLGSIEGIKIENLPTPINNTQQTNGNVGNQQTQQPIQQQPQQPVVKEPVVETQKVLLCKDDPKLEKYFKMLRYEIPKVQIQQKMMAEGVDPKLLDTPNEPSPFKKEEEEEELKTEGSFSSEED